MRLDRFVALAALVACAPGRDSAPDTRPVPAPAPAAVAAPMASFARMLPGEWRITYLSGQKQVDTWHWGPGRHSMRVTVDGADAAGGPWRELQAVYWHPGRKQVRMLSVNPYARSVWDGAIELAGEAGSSTFDLYQTSGRRDMALRWNFDGPDKYRETLLEARGPDGLVTMAEWDYTRSLELTVRPPAAAAPGPSEYVQALAPLLGHTWEARGELAGGAFHVRTSFEYVPYADAVYARTSSTADESTHLLDTYFYHHTGTGALRCLALANHGGVYEGDVTAVDGGLQLDLKGYEGDRVTSRVVRLDVEQDGRLRHRDWSVEAAGRTLVLDVHHAKLAP